MSGFKIKSADGQTITIPDGEYYFNTKARARRMMLNSLSSEARQVYACLELATMGFQQELAVTMENGKLRPLARHDIARKTALSEPHVRRGLVELESQGLAQRRSTDGGPLYKGKVEIYSWAEPRNPQREKGSQRAAPIPEWVPESWKPLQPLIKRLKLELLPELGAARDSILAEGEEIARGFEKAEKGARKFLKGVCARARPNKEERTERTKERTGRPESSSREEVIRREEAKTASTSPNPTTTKPTPPEPLPEPPKLTEQPRPESHRDIPQFSDPEKFFASYQTARDALVATMTLAIGRRPDDSVARQIDEMVETHGRLLKDYVIDVIPRISRLTQRPTEGFFIGLAKKRTDAPAPEPKKVEPPCACRGTGRLSQTEYCQCRFGRDLARVERRTKKAGSS